MEKKSIKGGNRFQMTSYKRKLISSNKKMVRINKDNDRRQTRRQRANGNKQYLTATFLYICVCVCTSICVSRT